MKKTALFTALLFSASAGLAGAATVTWSAATNIAAYTDVNTTGTLIGAWTNASAGSGTTATLDSYSVNGVTFDRLTDSIPTATGVNGVVFKANTNGTPPVAKDNYTPTASNTVGTPLYNLSFNANPDNQTYALLLGLGFKFSGAAGQDSIVLSNLVEGNQYLVQFWANFTAADARTVSIAGITLDANITNNAGSMGQYITGTFTADNTLSQTFTISGSTVTRGVNAFQVRDITPVPEPSTYALAAGVIAAGVALVARRRRKS